MCSRSKWLSSIIATFKLKIAHRCMLKKRCVDMTRTTQGEQQGKQKWLKNYRIDSEKLWQHATLGKQTWQLLAYYFQPPDARCIITISPETDESINTNPIHTASTYSLISLLTFFVCSTLLTLYQTLLYFFRRNTFILNMSAIASHLILTAINATIHNLAALPWARKSQNKKQISILKFAAMTIRYMLSSSFPNITCHNTRLPKITNPLLKKTAIRSSRTRGNG
jgi:hypothetical protein